MSFKGNLNFNTPKFTSYASEDSRMGSIGMGSYNVKSLKKVLTNEDTQEEAISTLIDPCTLEDEDKKQNQLDSEAEKLQEAFLGEKADDEGDFGHYYKFNQVNNKYEKTGIKTKISEIATYWDSVQKDPAQLNSNLEYKVLVQDVQNSLEGCIVFIPQYTGEQAEGEEFDFTDTSNQKLFKKTRVYFRSRSRYDDSREMVINGDPKISSVPRRPTGGKYDFARTQSVQLENIDSTSDENKQYGHIGRYSKNVSDKDIPSQNVAAKLRLSYNKALGYFESGTQHVVARLLDDLPAPSLKDVSLDRVDSFKFKDMYDKDGDAFFGGFSTGFAIPMTVHNGNPNTFGPNVIGKKAEYKKEKIRVVNRANASFNIGDIVMCCLIDNEWIVHGFGGSPAELEEVKFTVGKWSFIKMIADSDAYFRDDRWFTSNGNDEYNRFQRQDLYATTMREIFYANLNQHYTDEFPDVNLNYICRLNNLISSTVDEYLADPSLLPGINAEAIEMPDFTPSRRYVQSTIFDQLGDHMGGNNENGNIIGRTNRRVNPDVTNTFGDALADYNTHVPLFWGTVFPDGYNSSKGRKLTTQPQVFEVNGNADFFGTPRLTDVNSNSVSNNCLGSEKTFMFADQRDFSLSQLPAEVGLNAGPSGDFGYPIESISLLAFKESQNEKESVESLGNNTFSKSSKVDTVAAYASYLSDPERLSWISTSGDANASIYDLKPNISTQLDFIPLSFGMVGNADKASTVNNYNGYNTYDMARSVLKEGKRSIAHLWGKMFLREKPLTSQSFNVEAGRDITDSVISEAGFTGSNLPWDKYIKNIAYSQPDATPFYFSDAVGQHGSNTVGIIAARNTFSLNAGGSINFETDFAMGCNGKGGSTLAKNRWQAFGGGIQDMGGGISYNITQWGTRDTRVTAMGHTSLYVQVFDHWPEEQTIYDARYYTPLHFCAGPFNSSATSKTLGSPYTEKWYDQLPSSGYNTGGLAGIDYTRNVDEISYDIDFREPTYGHPKEPTLDNQIIPTLTLIDRYGAVSPRRALRKQSEWRVNTICRGMMVSSEAGFRHERKTIGLSLNWTIVSSGTGFAVGDQIILDATKSIEIAVTEVADQGAIQSISFVDFGKDLIPEDFASSVLLGDETFHGYIGTVKSELGDDATILFNEGMVYKRLQETPYPKQHGSVLNLTPTSQNGENGPIVDRKVSSLTITEPSLDNNYDAFYYHVNDVGHVDMFPFQGGGGAYSFIRGDDSTNNNYYVDQAQAMMQYVSLSVSAT